MHLYAQGILKTVFDNKPPYVKNLVLPEKKTFKCSRWSLTTQNYNTLLKDLNAFCISRPLPTVNFFLIHPVYIEKALTK